MTKNTGACKWWEEIDFSWTVQSYGILQSKVHLFSCLRSKCAVCNQIQSRLLKWYFCTSVLKYFNYSMGLFLPPCYSPPFPPSINLLFYDFYFKLAKGYSTLWAANACPFQRGVPSMTQAGRLCHSGSTPLCFYITGKGHAIVLFKYCVLTAGCGQ